MEWPATAVGEGARDRFRGVCDTDAGCELGCELGCEFVCEVGRDVRREVAFDETLLARGA